MPLSEQDKLEVAEIVKASLSSEEFTKAQSDTINSAITAHTKRLSKSLGDDVAKKIDEAIAKSAPPSPPPGDDDGKSKSTPKPKDDPETVAMRRELEELKAQAKREREAREAAERKQREADVRRALGELFDAGSVRPETKGVLTDWFFQNRIHFDDDGNPLVKIRRAGAVEDEHLPLDAGVKDYLKSKDAAPFLPAPNAPSQKGSKAPPSHAGATPTRYDGPARNDDEKLARAKAREDALRAQGFDR